MKLGTTGRSEVLSMGAGESSSMTIDAGDQSVLMQILSEGLYKDPIGSTIREWTSNALDSHTEAGVKEPVIVSIRQNKETRAWTFSVEDFGMGISPYRYENFIKKYAASSKRDDDTMLGAFGLGLKSGLSYSDMFSFISRYDGIETEYLMYKGEESTKIDIIDVRETELRNGTIFSIQIKDYTDVEEFREKARQQLCYFESVFFDMDYVNNEEISIHKGAEWKWSSLNEDEFLHLSLDNVYYPIDFAKLGINRITAPIAICFEVKEGLIPTPSREDIKYTPAIKTLIKEKLNRIATSFLTEFNNSRTEADRVEEIYDQFDSTILPIIDEGPTDLQVTINLADFIPYSTIKPVEPTVKGITKLGLKYFCSKLNYCLENFECRGQVSNGRFSGKSTFSIPSPISLYRNSSPTYIKCVERPKGVQLEYIKDIYSQARFIYEPREKKLGKPKDRYNHTNSYDYYSLLNLKNCPKEDWREIINEYKGIEKGFVEKFIPLERIVPSIEWLAERKANRKQRNLTKVEKVQVNPKFAQRANRGNCEAVFVSDGVKELISLRKMDRLYVYGLAEDKERLTNIFTLSRGEVVNSVIVAERDFKRIEKANFHNWITIDKFMEGKTQPFKKYVTAARISDMVSRNSKAFSGQKLIGMLSKPFSTKMEELLTYSKNKRTYLDTDFKKELFEFVEKENLWDPEIIGDVKNIEQLLSTTWDFFPIITAETYGTINPIAIAAMRDILKYRKFKLNLAHYPLQTEISEPPTLVNEEEEIEYEETEID